MYYDDEGEVRRRDGVDSVHTTDDARNVPSIHARRRERRVRVHARRRRHPEYDIVYTLTTIKAGIPRHRHRHGHPCRLPREDCPRAGHARGSSPTCPTRGAIFLARILARMSVRDARVYTCTVHDNLSCTGLQNYTIGASPMSVSVSVSVSVQWNSSFTTLKWVEEDIQRQQSTVVYTRRN